MKELKCWRQQLAKWEMPDHMCISEGVKPLLCRQTTESPWRVLSRAGARCIQAGCGRWSGEGYGKGQEETRQRSLKNPAKNLGDQRVKLGHLEGLQHFGSLGFPCLGGSPEKTPYILWEPSIQSRGPAPTSCQHQARTDKQPRFSQGARPGRPRSFPSA